MTGEDHVVTILERQEVLVRTIAEVERHALVGSFYVADGAVVFCSRHVKTCYPHWAEGLCELASARLNGMNVRFKSRLPWALAFSFARAIQQPALEIWQGKKTNALAAQQALFHKAMCNSAARRGEYTAVMNRKLAPQTE